MNPYNTSLIMFPPAAHSNIWKIKILSPLLFAPFLLLASPCLQASENLLMNPGLEQDDDSWKLFVPPESEGKGCEFTVSTDSPRSGNACGKLKSDDFARFSAGDMGYQGVPPRAGDRCRLTFWIRAADDVDARQTPAFVVRMPMQDIDGQPLPGSPALFIGLNGSTSIQLQENGLDLSEFTDPLPDKWQEVVSVFDVPEDMDVARLSSPQFFAYYTKGTIYIDDVTLERVTNDVPVSPSIKKP